jgi:hypothetical protein
MVRMAIAGPPEIGTGVGLAAVMTRFLNYVGRSLQRSGGTGDLAKRRHVGQGR